MTTYNLYYEMPEAGGNNRHNTLKAATAEFRSMVKQYPDAYLEIQEITSDGWKRIKRFVPARSR